MEKDGKYAISLTLLKSIGFYQMINPKSPKIFGCNVYNVIHIIIVGFTITVTITGLIGFVYNKNEFINNGSKNIQMLFYITCIAIGSIKIIIVICNADKLWESLNIAHEAFLTSTHCENNINKLKSSGVKSAKILFWYILLFYMAATWWIILPIIENIQETGNDHNNIRKNSIANFKYPITVRTFNNYYNAIYVVETFMTFYVITGLLIFDVFLLTTLQLVSIQYEIVSSAYQNLESKAENEREIIFSTKMMLEKLSLITSDCQHIYKYSKIICSISRPIVLIYMVGDSCGLITMPYLIVMCYVKNGLTIYCSDVFTFLWTLCTTGIQLYMFCNLYQLVNKKKESVIFGLYNCDWTSMDIKIKKRLLLIMQMNGTNNININVTPTKVIGLSMLTSIIRSSYNITSVMIKSNIHNIREY